MVIVAARRVRLVTHSELDERRPTLSLAHLSLLPSHLQATTTLWLININAHDSTLSLFLSYLERVQNLNQLIVSFSGSKFWEKTSVNGRFAQQSHSDSDPLLPGSDGLAGA